MTIKEVQKIISNDDIIEQLRLMQKIKKAIDSHSFTIHEEKMAEKELKEMCKEIIKQLNNTQGKDR